MDQDFQDKSQINQSILSSSFLDLRKTRLRYLALALAASLNLGSFFIYDNPAALQTQLQDVI